MMLFCHSSITKIKSERDFKQTTLECIEIKTQQSPDITPERIKIGIIVDEASLAEAIAGKQTQHRDVHDSVRKWRAQGELDDNIYLIEITDLINIKK